MGILSLFSKGNTLYYPGCMTKFVLKQEMENYKKILEKLGISFTMLSEEVCCGSPVLNAGYEKDAIKLARKNLEIFKKYNIRKIITNCPACFKFFKEEYKKMLPEWDIEVEHVVFSILNKLKDKERLIQNKANEDVVYHDPCHLGRHMKIYEEPRMILSLLGYNVKDMSNNRENSLCCGGGGGLKSNNTQLANSIAREVVKQAKKRANKIITTCPLCFANIAENSDIIVEEFSYVVGKALGLDVKNTDIKSLNKKEKMQD